MESDKPLSLPRSSDRDVRLEGLWRSKSEKESGYLYIAYGSGAHGSMLAFSKDKTGVSTDLWDFFVTRTAKHFYLNMTQASPKREEVTSHKTYTFLEYHFSWNGQLIVAPVGGKAFENAIKERKLHGTTNQFTTTISHEPVGRLLAFIETARPEDVFMARSAMIKAGDL